ncbi:class I SAM-dependent methyltransferase [Magnetovibrio sp.]|uniref:class I SAM-dependent methyltransferase n=1 Tax=Magnetovibrio sp. TaxID=2024836 RepID=UPI002F953BB3
MCLDHTISIASAQDANDFETRFVATLNSGAMCLMTSIGHRAGLFDAMAETGPATSDTIATTAGLQERYVREWLGAMVTGRFVAFDAQTRTYHLPAEHAACLTRASTPGNLATYAQYIPLLGQVEDELLGCFANGGGVPYARYPRFHEVMAEDSGQTVLPALIDDILPLAPGLVERLENGIEVLDVGCGRGRAINLLAKRFANSSFLGIDLSTEAVRYAQYEADAQGLTNARFLARDLSSFDHDAEVERFDLVLTFDAIHDQADPARVLRGIHRTLKKDGVYLAQDIKGSSQVEGNVEHPIGPLLYTMSTMHCMTVSLAQGGAGLGAMWGRELAESMFKDAGFRTVAVHELDHDIQNNYYVCLV